MRNESKIRQQRQKMMSKSGKAVGKGEIGGCVNTMKQAGKNYSMMRKQQGTQWQRSHLATPPHPWHHSVRLSSSMTANDEQAEREVVVTEDDSKDVVLEEMDHETQIPPVHPGQRPPCCPTKKLLENEARPTCY